MSSPRNSRRSLLVNLGLFALGFGLLGYVIFQKRDKIQDVFRNPVDYRLFALGLAIYLVALMLTFFRWQRLVLAQGLNFKLADAMRLGFIGNIFNLVIPGAVGGDVIKAAFLGRMQPGRKSRAYASMVLDRILGLLGLFLLAGLAGVVAFGSASPQVRFLIAMVWAATLSGLTALAVVFSPALYRPLNRLVAGRGKLEKIVKELEAIGLAYGQNIKLVGAMLALATFVHSLYVVAFYCASRSIFSSVPSLAEHYLMVPLVLFTTAVPIPFGGIGFVEQVSDQLFAMVQQKDGAIAMMAFRLLMYGSGIVSALIYLANIKQVQNLRHDPEAEQNLDDFEALPPQFDVPG